MILKMKKKGSSLVVVLMIFSVLTIFGMAILSLTLSAFQSRVVDNNSKINLYFSESGLDIAYGMVGNAVDAAIASGKQAVTAYMNSLDGPNGILQQEQQRLINGQPSAYPKSATDPSSAYVNTDGSIIEDYIKQQQNQIFRQNYQNYMLSFISDWFSNGVKVPDGSYNSVENPPMIKVLNNNIVFGSVTQNGSQQSMLNLQLESTFTDKSIQRTVDINYNILTPSYNDTYYVETNSVNLPVQTVWSKAFCIDGDLKIRGSLSVNGDAYVKGNSSGDNGIVINSDSYPVTFTGNLSTAGKFQIDSPDTNTTSPAAVSSPKAINIIGNVYTGNMELADGTSNINLTVSGSAFTNNDLALNGLKSNVKITNGFYGINDIHGVDDSPVNDSKKSNISSSIYVNSDDIGQEKGSSIYIGNEAILMGTAYIKTNPIYQTGESVAIKGNYIAYTNPLNSVDATSKGLNEDNVMFEYYNPLQVVTKFKDGNSLLFQDKSDYFNIYAKEYGTNSGLNLGTGITMPSKIISSGAVVANGNISTASFTASDQGEVYSKQDEFTKMAYEMGDNTGGNIQNAYANMQVQKTVSASSNNDTVTVLPQVDFTKLTPLEISTPVTNDLIYLNNDSSKNYILVGKNADTSNIPSNILSSATKIQLDSNGVGKGIIITQGNVYLCGAIEFTGTIIAGGNLEVTDDAQKTLTYNKSYIEYLIANNYAYFKDIFIGNYTQASTIQVNPVVNQDSNVGTDIVRDKLITKGNWEIVK